MKTLERIIDKGSVIIPKKFILIFKLFLQYGHFIFPLIDFKRIDKEIVLFLQTGHLSMFLKNITL